MGHKCVKSQLYQMLLESPTDDEVEDSPADPEPSKEPAVEEKQPPYLCCPFTHLKGLMNLTL